MPFRIPSLETERLRIREFTSPDLDVAHHLVDRDLAAASLGTDGAVSRAGRQRWLEWTVLNYEQLAYLRQPPYGDRAIVLKHTDTLIGVCGLVPCLAPFHQLPAFPGAPAATPSDVVARASLPTRHSPEVGLFWAIASQERRHGYATEAARAVIDYAFGSLRVERIVATTDHDNSASIGAMHKLGMRIVRNPSPQPPWLQVVGILEADDPAAHGPC